MITKVRSFLILVSVLICPLASSALEFGHYYPLYDGASWTYQSVVNPDNTYMETVCCPFEIDGQPALIYLVGGESEVACWKNGPSVVLYGYYQGTEFVDFVPDLILGSFEDGSIIEYPCDTPPCGQFDLVRVWGELDHPDLGDYVVDPNLENVILTAHYSDGDPPNHQNDIVESNLPAGVTPPPGAVTDLEWRQRGVGVIAYIGVDASTGDLHERYELIEVSAAGDEVSGARNAILLDQNSPNPFNPQTMIAFALQQESFASLRIYDVAGRLVRTLIGSETYPPGRHETVWNGRDDAERPMASGVYFYRLEAGGYCEMKRMVMVR